MLSRPAVTGPCSDSDEAQRRHRQGDGGPRKERAAEAHDPRRRQVPTRRRSRSTPIRTQAASWLLRVQRGRGRSEVVRSAAGTARVTGRARYDFHRHSVEIFFSKRSIGNPHSYGWETKEVLEMRAHTITTQARVGGRGRMKRRIVPGGILALSLAVVLLAATASTASAYKGLAVWCAPLPTTPTTPGQLPGGCIGGSGLGRGFHFGARQVGTTSPAQGFALGVVRQTTPYPRISVSGDYAQTNNCPPTLLHFEGCLIRSPSPPRAPGPRRAP